VTLTYTISGATSAFLGGDLMQGGPVPLIVDGQQHAYVYSPARSGPFPVWATDSAGGKNGLPVSVIVHRSLPPLDPNAPIARTTTQSGPMDDPATWGGALPGRDDTCLITTGHAVTATDRLVSSEVGRLLIDGSLVVTAGVVYATRVHVSPGGTLGLHGADTSNKALLILVNRPRHANDAADTDRGLLVEGTFRARGADVVPWVRLAREPKAGDRTLLLASPVIGWNPLNKLLLPDTRTLTDFANPGNHDEVLICQGVEPDGVTVHISQHDDTSKGLAYDHPGAWSADRTESMLPAVAHLIRTTGVVTEDPTDIPNCGAVRVTGSATLDCVGTVFHGLGRASFASPGSPPGFHLDHLFGPPGGVPCSDGQSHTYRIEDCVFIDPSPVVPTPSSRLWGIVIDDTHQGYILDAVVYNWGGAGVVFPVGSETDNVLDGAFVSTSRGYFGDVTSVEVRPDSALSATGHFATEGAGVWQRGFGNTVKNCYVSHVASYGYVLYARLNTPTVRVPNAFGADTRQPGQYAEVDPTEVNMAGFSGNESAGRMATGGTNWWTYGSMNALKGHRAWNCHSHSWYVYETNNFRIVDWYSIDGGGLFYSDYAQVNGGIDNPEIYGADDIALPVNCQGTTFTVNGGFMDCNGQAFEWPNMHSANGAASLGTRRVEVRGTKYSGRRGYTVYSEFSNPMSNANYVLLDQLFFYDYGGQAGVNFQVYYSDQAASAIMPVTTPSRDMIGQPPPGTLTNAQCWQLTPPIATCGAVAPDDAAADSRFRGCLVKSI
jgi:hypothetical protein